jgi:hypothetical protein
VYERTRGISCNRQTRLPNLQPDRTEKEMQALADERLKVFSKTFKHKKTGDLF